VNTKAADEANPVVTRIRLAREALARQCDYDVDRMVELFKSMQAEHADRVRSPKSKGQRASTTI